MAKDVFSPAVSLQSIIKIGHLPLPQELNTLISYLLIQYP